MVDSIGFDHRWVQTMFKIAGDYVVKNGRRRFRYSSTVVPKVGASAPLGPLQLSRGRWLPNGRLGALRINWAATKPVLPNYLCCCYLEHFSFKLLLR